jgi:carbon storage regulator CsrA
MLALTRRVTEEIVIGEPRCPLGVIRVVEIHGDKVRLSFDFPRDFKINRRELAEQKARQQQPPGHSPPNRADFTAAVDQAMRAVVHVCWTNLPDEKRRVDVLAAELRAALERVLQSATADPKGFGLEVSLAPPGAVAGAPAVAAPPASGT